MEKPIQEIEVLRHALTVGASAKWLEYVGVEELAGNELLYMKACSPENIKKLVAYVDSIETP